MTTEKTQTFPLKATALALATAAYKEAKAIADMRNANDPDLLETVTLTTNEAGKEYVLTRPDQQEGFQTVHYHWTD